MNRKLIARLSACAIVLATLTLGSLTATAATWYVSPTGSDAAAGTNWATAKLTIQAGVNAASANDTVLVTNGVYATGGSTINDFGGQYNQRVAFNKSSNVTLQSVNGPAVTIIDGGTNVGCVLFYETIGGRLSGFTLTHGFATSGLNYGNGSAGLGIFLSRSVLVDNCWMVGNLVANGAGAGVCMLDGFGYNGYSNRIVNCVISGNLSTGNGVGCAGVNLALGAYAHEITFDNCIISSNATGGVYLDSNNSDSLNELFPNSVVFNNCKIANNYAQGNEFPYGGGGNGAAVSAFYLSGIVSLNNCTVAGNICLPGGKAVVGLGAATNSIIYRNTDTNGVPADWDGNGAFAYSCAPGLTSGLGNRTNADFVSVSTGNYHLTPFDAACINTGLNAAAPGTTDLEGNPRIQLGNVDMGCYENRFTLQGLGTNGVLDLNALNALLNNPTAIPTASSNNTLYTQSQLQALNVNSPLLAKGTNGQFTLTIGVQRSTNLTSFTDLPLNSAGASTVIDGSGKLQFTFPGSNNAAFFKLQSQ
jgi:hypothetical protein